MQLVDAQLARAAREGGGAAAGQQGHSDSAALRKLGAEAVADVEFFDFAGLPGVDDLAVRPHAVDVGDDESDIHSLSHHPRMLTHQLSVTIDGISFLNKHWRDHEKYATAVARVYRHHFALWTNPSVRHRPRMGVAAGS